jgi:hypothetical protein
MRSYSGTIRYVEAEHSLAKLRLRREEAEQEGPLAVRMESDAAPGMPG